MHFQVPVAGNVQVSSQLIWTISVSIWGQIQCPFVNKKNPLALSASPFQPSGTIAPDPCQHHSAGEDHLLAQGYHVPQFLPCPVRTCYTLSMGRGRVGGQSWFYVPLPIQQNNGTILANVAWYAKWKLNCFLTRSSVTINYPTETLLWVTQGTKGNEAIHLVLGIGAWLFTWISWVFFLKN